MTTTTLSTAQHRDQAVLIAEGRQKFAAGDRAAAKAKFIEAARLDPTNRQVWLCLASVSGGTEQAEYLRRVGPNHTPVQPQEEKPGQAATVRRRMPAKAWFLIAGIPLLLVLMALGAWLVFRVLSAVAAGGTTNPGYTMVSASSGGTLNLAGKARLLVPAGSLPKDEQFRLSGPTHAPALPEKTIFKALGKPVQIETSATILRQPGMIGLRYDPSQLPANTDENSLQVARWDGSTWEIVDRTIDLGQKMIYVPLVHFSDPVFQVLIWPANLGNSALAKQVEAANRLYFKNETDPLAAELYGKIIAQFAQPGATSGVASLSAADQKNYWMACNLWGDALYKTGKYDQAGKAYIVCVDTALASGIKIAWENQLFSGPGYSLQALQNRYPLGINLTQLLRSGKWAAGIPVDSLTLATQSFTWQQGLPIEMSQLPPAVSQSILDYERALGRKPEDLADTHLDLVILSPQSQTQGEAAGTLQQTITPILLSSGIPELSSANLQDSAGGLSQAFGQGFGHNLLGNPYLFDPAQSGEGLHTLPPFVLLRVERAWTEKSGLTTHTQQLFTLAQSPSATGETIGAPIAEDAAYRLADGAVAVSDFKAQWIKMGTALTKRIKTARIYDANSLAVGGGHACAITRLHGLQCWGRNDAGQLGAGDSADRRIPVDVKGLQAGIEQVSAGEAHTCAISTEGKLFCWGANGSGQVGNGSQDNQAEPAAITGIPGRVTAVSAGSQHTCALTGDGTVSCWGSNASGELGTGNTDSSPVPVQVPGLSGVTAVAAGGSHTCALLQDGAVWCWGANAQGQLGNGSRSDRGSPVRVTGLSGVTHITAGKEHTCAISGEGAVSCWGANSDGQAGSRSTDASIAAPAGVDGLAADGVAVKSLISHTCAIQGAGVVCWGKNDAGQLGNGGLEDQTIPVSVNIPENAFASIGAGSDFSCARTEGGLIYCWGGNASGQLGSGSTTASLIPIPVYGFGSSIADPSGALELSPISEDAIELGTTIQIRNVIAPADTKSIAYEVSYDGQPFAPVGKTPGNDPAGVEWSSAGKAVEKKVIVKSIVEAADGSTTEVTSRVLTLQDTRKPTASIAIQPSARVIALGDTLIVSARDVADTLNGITGSGVKEVRFSVLKNERATVGAPVTLPYSPDKAMEITWSAPVEQNSHDQITFQLVVVDNAGNEYKVEDGGYSPTDQIQPNFIGDLQVKSDPKMNGTHIEIGAKVRVSVVLNDLVKDLPQGSGIPDLSFSVSVNGGVYKGISHQSFPKGLTPGTVTSLPWDMSDPKAGAGASVRFLVHVVDAAGKVTEKTSGVYKIDDTVAPIANSTLTVVTSGKNGDAFIKMSASGIGDGSGSGVSKAEFKVQCNGVDLFKNAPIVFENPSSEVSKTVALPPQAPSETCGYGKTLQVTLVLTDQKSNVNSSAATGSATYLYDVTAPTISSIAVPAQIESTAPLSIKVTTAREAGGSRVKTVMLDVKCNNTLIQEFPLQAQAAKSLEGENGFTWTPGESSAACPWGTAQYTFSAWAVDENGNGASPTKPLTKTASNYVDTKAPSIWIGVNGADKASLPNPIVQPLNIRIGGDDGPGGSGVDSSSLGMKIYYAAGYAKSVDRYPNVGPFPCGALKFVFSGKDHNFARNNQMGELVQYSSLPPQALSGSLAFPDAINALTVHLSATVKEPCSGLKNGSFQITYGSDQVTVPSSSVQRNSDNATVTVSADWTLSRADKNKYSGTSQLIQVKFTAVNNDDAQVSGSVDLEKTVPIKINETPTDITLSATSLAENLPASSQVGTFSTTDADLGDTFTYSLVLGTGSTDNAKFLVTGDKLQTTARFDYETRNSYSIRVRTVDSGGQRFDKVFTIGVSDVNDAPAITSNGGGATASITAAENSTGPVTTVTATDQDAGASLTYAISGGADAAAFTLDASSHQLAFVSPPDFEHPSDSGGDNLYDVTVQVSDGSLTDSQAIAVRVSDVSDSPIITSNGGGDNASVSLAENSGGPVTTVTASHPIAGATLTFSISGGADAARFALGAGSHVLTFVSPPDFESPSDSNADNVYHVIVSASDGSVSDSQDLAVSVTNVNEAPQINSNASILVAENSTDPVTTVSVLDPDAGTTLTFSITGGDDAAKFTIDSASGVLSFVSVPDYETPADSSGDNLYEVVVRVTDGALTDTRAFTVMVTDVIEP